MQTTRGGLQYSQPPAFRAAPEPTTACAGAAPGVWAKGVELGGIRGIARGRSIKPNALSAGWPGQIGQTSPAALSHTVTIRSMAGALGPATLPALLDKPAVSIPASSTPADPKGWVAGWDADCCRNKLRERAATQGRWRMASAMLRAELWCTGTGHSRVWALGWRLQSWSCRKRVHPLQVWPWQQFLSGQASHAFIRPSQRDT